MKLPPRSTAFIRKWQVYQRGLGFQPDLNTSIAKGALIAPRIPGPSNLATRPLVKRKHLVRLEAQPTLVRDPILKSTGMRDVSCKQALRDGGAGHPVIASTTNAHIGYILST